MCIGEGRATALAWARQGCRRGAKGIGGALFVAQLKNYRLQFVRFRVDATDDSGFPLLTQLQDPHCFRIEELVNRLDDLEIAGRSIRGDLETDDDRSLYLVVDGAIGIAKRLV